MPAMRRCFSRWITACGKSGCCSTRVRISSAAFFSVADERVRKVTPARSRSKLPPSSAPTSARRCAIVVSERPPAPWSRRIWVSWASPACASGSRALPAGKSTEMSRMGSSWLSTKITRAPCGVCQCWRVSAACADRGRLSNSATQKALIVMADSRHRGTVRLGLQGLRVEHAHAQLVVLQPLLRRSLDVLRADRAQFVDPLRERRGRKSGGHVFAQLHRLVKQRIALEDVGRNDLRLHPGELRLADALTLEPRDLV